MDLPPLPSDPRVAVVIPAREAAGTLAVAVESACAQPVHEVVIAVGPSRDGTAEVARRLAQADPRVSVVTNEAGSTPAGLNAAIEASTGEVVVRCDAHCVLPRGYVERALETMRSTDAVNVGGRQVPEGGSGTAVAVAAAMRSALGSGGARYRSGGDPGPTDTVYLGVFRRAALEKVGGFDESLQRNQDYELNIRLREEGGLVWFDPRLAVTYRPRPTLGALAAQYFDYGRFKRQVARMHPRALRLRQLAPPAFVLAAAASLVLAAIGQWFPAFLLVVVYTTAVVAAAWRAAPRTALVPEVAAALVVMHLAWGTGFLIGPPRRAVPTTADR